MTLDELRERIKDEVVLHEGNVADYQWRQMGLTDEAAKLGVSGPDFGRLVNQVSLTVAPDLGRITEIKEDILRLARQRRKQLTDADIRQLVDDAERAHLTRSFVVDTWIPTLLRQVPDMPEPSVPELPPTVPKPEPVAAPAAQPVAVPAWEPVAAPGETAESVRRKVTEVLSDYDGYIPAPAIRSLFRTINYNEADLSVAIWNYLQIHQYVPDREPPSGSLRDKLTSTDWRYPAKTPSPTPTPPSTFHSAATPPASNPFPPAPSLPPSPPPVVRKFTATPGRVRRGQAVTLEWEVDDLGEGLSPRNRGWVKPIKTADYTLFDVNNNPLSTVRVEVIPPDRSGLYGVLFALALLGLIYWFVKGNTANEVAPQPERQTERTTRPAEERPRPAAPRRNRRQTSTETTTRETTEASTEANNDRNKPVADAGRSERASADKPASEREALDEPVTKPATPADARAGKYEEAFGDKPYDKVELGTDERGWRRARSNGRWGFISQNDEWVIPPEYEAVTPFRGNTAGAFLNGQLITINRSGEPVRK